jgi:hypothetical protein
VGHDRLATVVVDVGKIPGNLGLLAVGGRLLANVRRGILEHV